MPSRTDKLDAMTLAASLTGFEFDIIEGVQGDSVSQKALSGVSSLRLSLQGYSAKNYLRNGRRDLVLKESWAVGVDT